MLYKQSNQKKGGVAIGMSGMPVCPPVRVGKEDVRNRRDVRIYSDIIMS